MFGVGGKVAAALLFQSERLSAPTSSAMTRRIFGRVAEWQRLQAIQRKNPTMKARRSVMPVETDVQWGMLRRFIADFAFGSCQQKSSEALTGNGLAHSFCHRLNPL